MKSMTDFDENELTQLNDQTFTGFLTVFSRTMCELIANVSLSFDRFVSRGHIHFFSLFLSENVGRKSFQTKSGMGVQCSIRSTPSSFTSCGGHAEHHS